MMQKNDLRVLPRDNGMWALQRDGAARAISTYPTKRAAREAAQVLARREGVELSVQNRLGWVTAPGAHLFDEVAAISTAVDLLQRRVTRLESGWRALPATD